MKKLSDRELKLLAIWLKGTTLRDMAKSENVSDSRIHQILAQIRRKLCAERHFLNSTAGIDAQRQEFIKRLQIGGYQI